MKLEVSKQYKTRAGDKVTIVSDRMTGDDRWLGIIHRIDFESCIRYRENGTVYKIDKDDRDIVAEWAEPKPPQYVPYEWPDRGELRGRWYRGKGTSMEIFATCFDLKGTGELLINGIKACDFLEYYEWLDGTPCGKVVE